jgi:predicted GNAT family N-acyltransferase
LQPFRGKGVGIQLLQALEQQARLNGYTFCILDSQCQAEPFYAKAGYVTISNEPFDDAGIMHVRMQKTL